MFDIEGRLRAYMNVFNKINTPRRTIDNIQLPASFRPQVQHKPLNEGEGVRLDDRINTLRPYAPFQGDGIDDRRSDEPLDTARMQLLSRSVLIPQGRPGNDRDYQPASNVIVSPDEGGAMTPQVQLRVATNPYQGGSPSVQNRPTGMQGSALPRNIRRYYY